MAWVDSSPSRPGQPFHIGVLSDSRSLTYLSEQIRERIQDIEADFDTTIEVHTFSRADAPDLNWDDVHLLAGRPGQLPRGIDRADPIFSEIDRIAAHCEP